MRTETEPRDDPGATGHRQRLRQRLLTSTGEPLTGTDLLELLLCFAIPRKDVRPLAESLLQRFGSLPCVVGAERGSLQGIDGLGEASLALLTLVGRLREHAPTAPGAGEPVAPGNGRQLALFPPPEKSALPDAGQRGGGKRRPWSCRPL